MKEVLYNIGFDWQVALANLVNFLIIFWVLKKWVFGPVGALMDKRQETIEQGVSQAHDAKEQLANAQQASEDLVKQSKQDANQIIAEAQEKADAVVAGASEKADAKAQGIIDDAHVKIDQDRKNMEKDLFAKTASLVTLGVQKILDEDLTAEQNERVTKRALDIINKA